MDKREGNLTNLESADKDKDYILSMVSLMYYCCFGYKGRRETELHLMVTFADIDSKIL